MANFYDYILSAEVSVQELDNIALQATYVARIADGYARTAPVPNRGDWGFKWIGTGGCGNKGTLVLVPTNARTHGLIRKGIVDKAIRAGMPKYLAEKFSQVRVQYKHELLELVTAIMKDEWAVKAMLAHDGSNRRQWKEAYGNLLPEGVSKLSAPREFALAELVRELLK